MKFFKHFTDAHEGKSMMALMAKFGLEGYAAFFILTEICAKKLEKHVSETYAKEDMKFTFNERIVREKLRMRSTKVELFLNYCSTLDLLQFTKVEEEFNFSFPKLLESMDRDSIRARTVRAIAAPKRKRKNKEKEKDREVYEQLFEIWNSHRNNLPEALAWSDKRRKAAKDRWSERPDAEFWTTVAQKLAASDFCNGKKGGSWTANFDFFLRPETHLKANEGQYDNQKKPTNSMAMVG